MGNQQERSKLKLAWLAGIFEGEGWISLCKVMSQKKEGNKLPAFTPNIGVSNTDEEIMSEVMNILDSHSIKYRFQVRNRKGNKSAMGYVAKKTIYELSVATHENVISLAKLLLPYFIGEKKHRLIKLIEFIDYRRKKPRSGKNSAYGEHEQSIYQDMYSYLGKSQFGNPQRLHARIAYSDMI